MTTIAYDGMYLAVDSQSSNSWKVPIETQKIFANVGEFQCVAFCGEFKDIHRLLQWVEEGCNEKDFPGDTNSSMWAVRQDGTVWVYPNAPIPEQIDHVHADGSGAPYAMGALMHGADAISAVEIASRLDFYTGGTVVYFRINNGKKLDVFKPFEPPYKSKTREMINERSIGARLQ